MSIDPNTLEKIKKACSPQKAIYEIADFVSTDILPDVENATNTANAALGQANSAYNRATEALNGVSRMEQQVEDSVIELTDRVNGSTVTIVGNKNSGASTEVTLPVSSRLQAGVMNSATYATLDELGNRVTALESNTVTYLVTLPNDNPTQAEINSAYQTAYPTAPFPPNDGTTVIDQGKQLFYRYVKNGNLWIKTTGFTISQWTNDTLGTVKGSTTPGQIQAETDGTGSLVGYDVMVANIASNTDAILANQASIKTLQQNDIDIGTRIDDVNTTLGTAVNDITTTPTATELTITALKIGGTSKPVTINPVDSRYAGIVTPTMFEQWNNKPLNYQTAFIENKNYLKFEIMYNDSLTELFRFEKPTPTSLSINLKTSTINPNATRLRSGFIYYGTANGNKWVNLNTDNTITITDEHAFFNVVIGNLYGALGFHGCTIPIGITNPVSSTDFNQTYVFYTIPKTPYIKVTYVRQS